MTTQQGPGSAGGPTALRMLLGAHLRRLRERAEISREDAGWRIRGSESKISRMELGRVSFKERDVADLIRLYGVDDEEECERLLSLARDANTPGWWHRFGDVLPGWFQSYVGLEATAAMIRNYEPQFIPGLLQTREYARGVVSLGHAPASAAEIDRRVELRISRQKLLTRPDAPRFWAVLDEAALRRPVGGIDAMRGQLQHLIDLTSKPNIQLQIIPFRSGGHPAAGGGFTLLRFADQALPDLIYVEQLTSAIYLDKRDDIEEYVAAMEKLCTQAETPDRTPVMLEKMIHDLDDPTRYDAF